jgi:hypothetical protein
LFLLYVLRNFTLDIFQHIGGIIIYSSVLMRGKCLSYTEYTQKNGAISKFNKKFISHLTRAQQRTVNGLCTEKTALEKRVNIYRKKEEKKRGE